MCSAVVSNFRRSSQAWEKRLKHGCVRALLWLFIHSFITFFFSFHLRCNKICSFATVHENESSSIPVSLHSVCMAYTCICKWKVHWLLNSTWHVNGWCIGSGLQGVWEGAWWKVYGFLVYSIQHQKGFFSESKAFLMAAEFCSLPDMPGQS